VQAKMSRPKVTATAYWRGVASHVGLRLLTDLADRTGLVEAFSHALARCGPGAPGGIVAPGRLWSSTSMRRWSTVTARRSRPTWSRNGGTLPRAAGTRVTGVTSGPANKRAPEVLRTVDALDPLRIEIGGNCRS
jgi:hypothetical protein